MKDDGTQQVQQRSDMWKWKDPSAQEEAELINWLRSRDKEDIGFMSTRRGCRA